jgi:hypothetical protein
MGVFNKLTISHADESEMRYFVNAYNEGQACGAFLPAPNYLWDDLDALKAWCTANWGTPWDVGYDDETVQPDGFRAEVETAEDGKIISADCIFFSHDRPPLVLYKELVSRGFSLRATYLHLDNDEGGGFEDGKHRSGQLTLAPPDHSVVSADETDHYTGAAEEREPSLALVFNKLIISHKNEGEMRHFIDAYNHRMTCHAFIYMPIYLFDEDDAREAWCTANWGTPEDVGYETPEEGDKWIDHKAEVEMTEDGKIRHVICEYHSLDGPPLVLYKELVSQGFNVRATYCRVDSDENGVFEDGKHHVGEPGPTPSAPHLGSGANNDGGETVPADGGQLILPLRW